jgi:L-seryl-tRNA(Ser) seleniumtransferase
MDEAVENVLRGLPAVGEFLASEVGRKLSAEFGEGMTKFELRQALAEMREGIRKGKTTQGPTEEGVGREVAARLRRSATGTGRRAINATGILLHTGLGRAPMCEAAIAAMAAAAGNTPLQASLDSGDRSLREERVQAMLRELTGCEAATVVNNNAAATMLVLNTLAGGGGGAGATAAAKEVIISRGQLIEIGGSFRMTEVMAQSGAILREVGTTNRTHLRDYEAAIGEQTAALIRVHTSNYRIRGFAGTPGIAELTELGRKRHVPVIDDLGSGALVPLAPWGMTDEPLVRDSIAAGVDVACFSGDKLIGGPQAGIICGRATMIERMRKNPYARMFRVCKLTLAGLEATLAEFINGTWRKNIPLYQMLDRPMPELETTARDLAGHLSKLGGVTTAVGQDVSYIGSGSLPDEGIATWVVRLRHARRSAADFARRLRLGVPSVFGRLADGEVVLDMRTLRGQEAREVAEAVGAAIDAGGGKRIEAEG